MDLEDNTVDKLSYQIALMRDLAQGKRDIAYKIADKGKLKTYHLKVVGEEILDTELGQLKTVKLLRQGSNKKRFSYLWCALKLHYLPVKVEHHEPKGDVITLTVKTVKFEP